MPVRLERDWEGDFSEGMEDSVDREEARRGVEPGSRGESWGSRAGPW